MIIIEDIEQGSPKWFALRCGIPSASNFDKIVTTKGEPSKQSERYMFDLAMERIRGEKIEGYSSGPMAAGIEAEPESRKYYEFINGVQVKQVALCYRDERKIFSCSPDGLIVENNAGLELKNPIPWTHWHYMQNPKSLIKAYYQQIQGGLYVTGADYWDIMSYSPNLRAVIERVFPDKEFHLKLGAALEIFCEDLDNLTEKIRRIK